MQIAEALIEFFRSAEVHAKAISGCTVSVITYV